MIRLGILGAAEIANRRFMPAVRELSEQIIPVVVAEEYSKEKLDEFCKSHEIEGCSSFEEVINRDDIDAIYVPQPPALHYKWAKMALEAGKHVLVEKPSTTSIADSMDLVETAKTNNLALHENYMFQYHAQIAKIEELIENKTIGETRLVRANFSFPFRTSRDFRYNRALGGGALLDAGGYTVKLITLLLGKDTYVKTASLDKSSLYDVDITGSATLSNKDGLVGQVYFSMDSVYQCSLEILGEKGRLFTNRVFTAPPDLETTIIVEKQNERLDIRVKPDSHFVHSIEAFVKQVQDHTKREESYDAIIMQAKLIEDIRYLGR